MFIIALFRNPLSRYLPYSHSVQKASKKKKENEFWSLPQKYARISAFLKSIYQKAAVRFFCYILSYPFRRGNGQIPQILPTFSSEAGHIFPPAQTAAPEASCFAWGALSISSPFSSRMRSTRAGTSRPSGFMISISSPTQNLLRCSREIRPPSAAYAMPR